MTKVKLTVAYDGTDFTGFQIQEGFRTVQAELDRILSHTFGCNLQVVGASRTDAGVHAVGQVVHVEIDKQVRIPIEQWDYVLRYRMPRDLMVTEVLPVSEDFHARHSARNKVYRYTVSAVRKPAIFTARFVAHVPYALDVDAMREAALALLGEHDFTSFCTARAQQPTKVRTIRSLMITETPDHQIVFEVEGNGFLHNMVRIMVGTLIEMGRHQMCSKDMGTILEMRDRRRAGPTAPPHGLCLCRIDYPHDLTLPKAVR